ncbi:EndoU domain-containing protein [Paenibacillus rhizoplanae]
MDELEGSGVEGPRQAGKPIVDKEKWLGNLQNTENFKQGTKENGLNHIFFDGEILKKMGMLMVFHYEGMPNSNGKIVGDIDPPNEFGVYQAIVEINGVLKGPKSTFFSKRNGHHYR